MGTQTFILAIDQGTSSTKALVVDAHGRAVAKGSAALTTRYLDNGFVEQDPDAIFQNVLDAVKACLRVFTAGGFSKQDISAIGISNQRETFVVWDETGKPLYNAVVWQCKRSVAICSELQQQGLTETVKQKTGLVIDPYFSATKLIWLYRNNVQVRSAIDQGRAYFGTIDTWLLYKLTNGQCYVTDHTNASRTMLFNLHALQWDADLVERFGLRGLQLPAVMHSAAHFGDTTLSGLLDRSTPVCGMIGDSHAAAFGEGCFDAGTAKATLGTGCSILMNIGSRPASSAHGMITTICWSIPGRVDYALEGVIVSCGATIEWIKNELHLFSESRETEAMAMSVADNGGVYLVPAFSGLGSPHWQMDRRASITGMSFGTTKNHIVRAALESIPFQLKDVMVAMQQDAGIALQMLNADGGMTSNTFVMQSIADLLSKPVASIGIPDVSALGAAYMAGIQCGVFAGIDDLRKLNAEKKIFEPGHDRPIVSAYAGWQDAIKQYDKL